MPVNLVGSDAGALLVLEGVVTAEETDQFVALLVEYPDVRLDLSACEHLHTAVLQAILQLRPNISALPADPFWSRCISISVKEHINEDDFTG
jgi:hypothetical protein